MSFVARNNLSRLAELNFCDKWGSHFYTRHYQQHFQHLRTKPIRVLEIGVGGYDLPEEGGASLRMWRSYFRNAQITGIDIQDKSPHEEDRIKIYKGSQTDATLLQRMHDERGPFDLIIDDGSHMNEHVISSFETLFPLLSLGGIYAVEDTQTSYWKTMGGDGTDRNNPSTMLNFFKGLTDCLNFMEFECPGYEPTYYDTHIVGMHFYHNLVFIEKGTNDEKSNRIVDFELPKR